MKRLTYIDQENEELGYVIDHENFDKAVDKLAEFEDFMEEVGAESLNELETCIVDLKQENQELKDRWQKLKEILIKSRDINKDNINCTTLIGVLGAEAFSELLLREMEELEKGGK